MGGGAQNRQSAYAWGLKSTPVAVVIVSRGDFFQVKEDRESGAEADEYRGDNQNHVRGRRIAADAGVNAENPSARVHHKPRQKDAAEQEYPQRAVAAGEKNNKLFECLPYHLPLLFNRHSNIMTDIEPAPHPSLTFIHITDTHLLDDEGDALHGVDTGQTLRAVLRDAARCFPDADFTLFTGDISQTGNAASYRLFQSALAGWRTPVYCVPGNHDTPARLRRIAPTCPDRRMTTVDLGAAKLLLLNSRVAGQHHGRLSDGQIEQLERCLGEGDDKTGVYIVALHHPPVAVGSRWLDRLNLTNADKLLSVLGRRDLPVLLLCGHAHQEIDRRVGNIRILATPSTCYQFVAYADTPQREQSPRPAYRFVRVDAQGTVHTQTRFIRRPRRERRGGGRV